MWSSVSLLVKLKLSSSRLLMTQIHSNHCDLVLSVSILYIPVAEGFKAYDKVDHLSLFLSIRSQVSLKLSEWPHPMVSSAQHMYIYTCMIEV